MIHSDLIAKICAAAPVIPVLTIDRVEDAQPLARALIAAALEFDLALLPGAATATEAMRLLEQGFTFQKFFPAEAAGGALALGSMAGPLPQITFCPTGGVTPENAKTYLALPNTLCVGGSWIAPKALVATGAWDEITQIARRAASLLK